VKPTARLGIVQRSRHIGLAVLRGTTLVCFATRRQTGQRTSDVGAEIDRLCHDHGVDEIIIEPRAHRREPFPMNAVQLSLDSAMPSLLARDVERHTQRALISTLLTRYPALRVGRRLSRDRIVALYAVALALARAATTN
jgi:hypothetical protein